MNENMSSDNVSIQTTLQVILTEIRGLNVRFDGLETRLDALEARFDRLEARVDKLEARFDALEEKVDQLTRDTAQMWQEIVKRVDDRTDEIRHDLAVFKSDIRADLGRLSQLWRSQLDFESQNLHARIGDLEQRVAAVERRIDEKTSE